MRQPTELGITELSEFCGLASREEDLAVFFDILALKDLTPEESILQKISIRRAWVVAEARMIESSKQREARVKPAGFQISTSPVHTPFLELWGPAGSAPKKKSAATRTATPTRLLDVPF